MPFLQHLEELRWRLIKSGLAVIVCAIPCGIFWEKIFDFVMLYPLHLADAKPRIIYTEPTEAVILSFKIALSGGLILAAPVIFYQLWQFVSPGLYKNEKKFVLPTVIASTFFFIAGIAFSYVTLPLVLRFLTGFAASRMEPFFKPKDYFGFILKITLSFGVVFELPVVSFVLSKIGLLTPGFLIRNFRYSTIIIFLLAAILTPPDILSQLLLALPLLILYGISIAVAAVARKGRT